MRLSLPPAAAPLDDSHPRTSAPELVAIVASLMALNAFAIDVMLPALRLIATDFAVLDPNDQQQVILAYVLGFGTPQLVWGPLADRFGRRPIIFVALVGYTAMGFLALAAGSFFQLLVMRFAQGVFAAGCRVVAVAVVRDVYAGRGMARIMSLVMTVFMVVPITSPMIGQAVLLVAPWEALFVVLGGVGLAMFAWTYLRLHETLPAERRTTLDLRGIAGSYLAVLRSRVTLGYMLASGVVFASLFAYLAASEQVFREVFGVGDTFVFWFAGVAVALSGANFLNSRLVKRFGMRRLSHTALVGFTVLSAVLLAAMAWVGEELWLFFPLFAIVFALFGLLGANFNALAMEPLGKVAGTASAAYGFATTTVSAIIGGAIGDAYDGSTLPLLAGFTGLGLTCLLIVTITERGRLFVDPAQTAGRESA